MEVFDLAKAREIYEKASELRREAQAKLKEWEETHDDWEDSDELSAEYDDLYNRYDVLNWVEDAADDYIYGCTKLQGLQDEFELALTEAGWDNEK